LEIIRETEDFLRERQELGSQRLWAINHARLEVARQVWRYDAALAVEIDRTIHRSQPDFEPGGEGRRIPYSRSYRFGYRLMGFRLAEKLAGWQRGKEQA
jgi:hypothetical protein